MFDRNGFLAFLKSYVLKRSKFILPIIVVSQFCCTSLWFASNGVMDELLLHFDLAARSLGHLTTSVQFGFLLGTLVFAMLSIADRYSPSKVFFVSSLLASFFNLGLIWDGSNIWILCLMRFLTGFFLAGIYPVGLKIASDYYEKGLSRSLGFLVGALVIGTAFPHLAKEITSSISWKSVLIITSTLAFLGGVLVLVLVPDGPYRKKGTGLNISSVLDIFRNSSFRSAAFGYFGHMWELYAFWAFVPVILRTYLTIYPDVSFNIPFLSFCIIGIGGLACIFSGIIAQTYGPKRVAMISLLLSGSCCFLSPFIIGIEMHSVFIAFLFFWGIVVIADSPLFSTLVAQNVLGEMKGTALTIVNCIGFGITIISIQLLNVLQAMVNPSYIYIVLGIGPVLGLVALFLGKKIISRQ